MRNKQKSTEISTIAFSKGVHNQVSSVKKDCSGFTFLKNRNFLSTMGESQKALLDKAKKLAAYMAVDEHVKVKFMYLFIFNTFCCTSFASNFYLI